MRCLAPVLLLSALTGCGGPPTPEELYGLWANTDADGTVRVLDFDASGDEADLVGLTDVYHLSLYPSGTAPAEAQRGTFTVAEGDGWELVTTVTAALDPATIGTSYGNPILDFDGETLTLETTPGSERVYTATDAMP